MGQYEGYLKEPGVRAQSPTDTLAACAVYSDLPQWAGVPLELWAGKGVDRKESAIRIEYREDDEGDGGEFGGVWGGDGRGGESSGYGASRGKGGGKGVLSEVLTALHELQWELSQLKGEGENASVDYIGGSRSSSSGSDSSGSGGSSGNGSSSSRSGGISGSSVRSLALVLQVQPEPVRYLVPVLFIFLSVCCLQT
jgi:hypothetical protein